MSMTMTTRAATDIDFRLLDTDEDGIVTPSVTGKPGPRPPTSPAWNVLQDLVACRQLLDTALKDG